MNSPVFSQSHNMQKWVYPILFIILLIMGISQYLQPQPMKELLIPVSIVVIVVLLLHFVQLDYKISADGIQYRFRPFIKEKFLPSTEIASIHAIQISPLKEFGGWGLRFGRLGKAYTTSGKCILHIKPHAGNSLNFTVSNTEDFLIFAAKHKLPFTVSGERPL